MKKIIQLSKLQIMKKFIILIFGICAMFSSCKSGDKSENYSSPDSLLRDNLAEIKDKINLYLASYEVMQVVGKLNSKDYEGVQMIRDIREYVSNEYDRLSDERENADADSKYDYSMQNIIYKCQEANSHNDYGKWFGVLHNEYLKIPIKDLKWELLHNSETSKIWKVSETTYDFLFIVEIFDLWDMYDGYENIWLVSVRAIEGQPFL
jgi:hypothetical protein